MKYRLTVGVLAAVILWSTPAFAGPIRSAVQGFRANHGRACGGDSQTTTACNSTATSSAQVTPTGTVTSASATSSFAQTTVTGGLAQQKAEIQARSGRCFHPGGSLGGGTHEGCGFSSVSADHAVSSCCYWGQLNPIDIGVAQGPGGWYATVIYGHGPIRTLVGGLVNTVGDTLQATGQALSNVGERVTNGPIQGIVVSPGCANGTCPTPAVRWYVR